MIIWNMTEELREHVMEWWDRMWEASVPIEVRIESDKRTES
jgi:hypothetical protein